LFTAADALEKKYSIEQVNKMLRIRDEYQWMLANPDAKDRQFVDEFAARYNASPRLVYGDLALVKQLLPALTSSSRDYHRWRTNQMLIETYQMAKKRKDTKTMERAASSYGKYNRVDLEDEQVMPYDMIVVQPFTATQDPSVLGIKPIPNIDEVIKNTIAKYAKESRDIEDVEYEEADLQLEELYGNNDTKQNSTPEAPEEDIL
jgi:hypothetical protein